MRDGGVGGGVVVVWWGGRMSMFWTLKVFSEEEGYYCSSAMIETIRIVFC